MSDDIASVNYVPSNLFRVSLTTSYAILTREELNANHTLPTFEAKYYNPRKIKRYSLPFI